MISGHLRLCLIIQMPRISENSSNSSRCLFWNTTLERLVSGVRGQSFIHLGHSALWQLSQFNKWWWSLLVSSVHFYRFSSWSDQHKETHKNWIWCNNIHCLLGASKTRDPYPTYHPQHSPTLTACTKMTGKTSFICTSVTFWILPTIFEGDSAMFTICLCITLWDLVF